MFTVIFEGTPAAEGKDEYLSIAASLRKFLGNRDGFISIERFHSLSEKGKLLSLSFWQDEESIELWRNLLEHRVAQKKAKLSFRPYRIRVAEVFRDHTATELEQVPADSNQTLS